MRIELQVEFYVRVMPNAESIAAAARTLGHRTMNPENLRDLVQGRFVDAMGAAAASMTMEHIHEKRADFIRAVRAQVADSLTQNGMELEAVSLTNLDQADMNLFNPLNAFDAEGLTRLTEEIELRKKIRNDIEQDTMIAVRQKNLEAEKIALSIQRDGEYARMEQEREVATRRSQQRAEIAREKTEREREIEEAEIHSREEIEKSRLSQERAVDIERVRREQDLERLEIERQKQRQIEEHDSVIAIAHKSKEQSEAQTEAETARALMIEAQERVVTIRETEVAERRKRIAVIVASQAAEGEAVRMKILAEAEKKAATDKAEADGIEVAALKVRNDVEAEGKRQLNEAENLRSDASRRSALHRQLVENLPAIIHESVKPMERIELDQDPPGRRDARLQQRRQRRRGAERADGRFAARGWRWPRREFGGKRRQLGAALPCAGAFRRNAAPRDRDVDAIDEPRGPPESFEGRLFRRQASSRQAAED